MLSLTMCRRKLNTSVAAFQARRSDIDCDGTVFLAILWIFLLALIGRWLLVELSGVPLFETGVTGNLALCAISLFLSMAAAQRGFVEANLLLRAGAIAFSASPWTLPACALIFHIGRQSPFVDSWLAAADHRLGFDWLAVVRYVDGQPILWYLLKWSYRSILYQVQIVCVLLAFTRSATRLYAFLCAQFFSLVIVAEIAILFPAVGTYVTFGAPQDIVHYQDFLPPDWVVSTITSLRETPVTGIVESMPLITFPSYHACSAVLFAWALWKTPYIRWAALVLNLGMLAATPVLGCHYLVDVVAGAIIAFAMAFAAHAAVRWIASATQRSLRPTIGAPAIAGL